MTNIELIKAGKLAIRNDDKEATIKCIVHIWPTSMSVKGSAKLYGQADFSTSKWTNIIADLIDLPTIPATDLLKEIEQAEWKPKQGELVEVSVGGNVWHGEHKYFGVGTEQYPILTENEVGQIASWKHIRPLPTKHKVTQSALLAEYAKAKGIEVSQIEITD